MLATLMNERRISIGYAARDYEDAIREAGRLLRDDSCVTGEYIDACVDAVKKLGPYMVLAKGIALPHARPEQGVLKTSISLAVLKEPVNFGHAKNDPVKVIFLLAASDSTGHLGALQGIAALALNRERFDCLTRITDPAEALAFIRETV